MDSSTPMTTISGTIMQHSNSYILPNLPANKAHRPVKMRACAAKIHPNRWF